VGTGGGAFIPVVNRPGREAGRSLPSSAHVKNDCKHIRKLDSFSHDTGLT